MIKKYNDKVDVNQDFREIIHHGSQQFPLKIYTNEFQLFLNHQISWHWHPDLEFSIVQRGSAEISVDNKSFILNEGEGIFVNTNAMHMMRPARNRPDSILESFVFSASLLENDPTSSIFQKYISPLIHCKQISAIFLPQDLPWQQHVLNCFHQLYALDEINSDGHELRVRILLCDAWLALALNSRSTIESAENTVHASHGLSPAETRARQMLTYIHAHFSDSVSVDDIAAAANISRSECFRIFNTVIQQKPIEYLIDYRLTKAQHMLRESAQSITDISCACGFNHTSYFCRLFKEKCGMSPKAYRSKNAHMYLNPFWIDDDNSRSRRDNPPPTP